MSTDMLSKFIGEVMTIDASQPGFGSGSTGIIGSLSPTYDVVNDLRKNIYTFASEYHKSNLSKGELKNLANKIEGSLQALSSFSVISQKKLDSLLSELDNLTEE